MDIHIPSPAGFLSAPNGDKSAIRLVLAIAILVGVLFLLGASAALVWIALYRPDVLTQLGVAFGGMGGGWAFLCGKLAKWKAVQMQWEPTAPATDAQAKTGQTGNPASGGPDSALAASSFLDGHGTDLQTVANVVPVVLPHEAVDLILEAEGVDQPWEVPPDSSGISFGHGWDASAEKHYARDWQGVLTDDEFERLGVAVGKGHTWAVANARHFRDIHISSSQADRVFYAQTLPQEIASAQRAMPGFSAAPPMIQGVIVSLGYNRGWSMDDVPGQRSRRGMREIRDAVASRHWEAIPGYLRAMATLWPPGNGVHTRRLAEAALAERGLADALA